MQIRYQPFIASYSLRLYFTAPTSFSAMLMALSQQG
jgi:hypothetical protein